jgi:hypothetical protein
MMSTLWKLLAEIEVEPGDLGLDARFTKGYMNVVIWAESVESAEKKLSSYLNSFNWKLLGLDELEVVDPTLIYQDEIGDMVERARSNANAIILGTFHSYRAGSEA